MSQSKTQALDHPPVDDTLSPSSSFCWCGARGLRPARHRPRRRSRGRRPGSGKRPPLRPQQLLPLPTASGSQQPIHWPGSWARPSSAPLPKMSERQALPPPCQQQARAHLLTSFRRHLGVTCPRRWTAGDSSAPEVGRTTLVASLRRLVQPQTSPRHQDPQEGQKRMTTSERQTCCPAKRHPHPL